MFNFGTMGRRVLGIVSAVVFAGILLFGCVSFVTLMETERDHSRASLETLLGRLKADVEQDYLFLLHLSQQMSPSGPVGLIVSDYLHAEDVYEQGLAKRMLARALSTYAGLGSELVTYVDAALSEPVFFNFTPEADMYQRKKSLVLYENFQLAYHAIHPSYSRHAQRPVVSLSRQAPFGGGVTYEIYIEQAVRAPQALAAGHIFLQLDTQGVVRYASDETLFPLGSAPAFPEGGYGRFGPYYFARADFVFGASCAVLAPRAVYGQSMARWLGRSLLAAAAIVLFVFAGSTLLYRYVFTGLRIFSREIDKTIRGDLTSTAQATGINELDALLRHFDEMKARIQDFMREAAQQEEARRLMEHEQLVYQINPHFLLNTLNSLHWLAAMNRQGEIARYISSLSAILSYNLGRTGERPTLRSELAMLQQYLEIEQCRHNFHVALTVEEGVPLDLPAPRLLLQPIVENAIGHGMDDGGSLAVTISRAKGRVAVVIEDDGCGIARETLRDLTGGNPKAAGVGLRYVRTMLASCYGGAASLDIESKLGGGTRVTLTLPVLEKGEANGPRDDH